MAPSTRLPERGEPRAPSANDRFKAAWGTRVAWSTVAAVAIHAALFGLHPTWVALPTSLRPDSAAPPVDWISLLPLAPALPDGPPTGLHVSEVVDSAGPGDPAAEEASDGRDVTTNPGGVRDELLDRLRGGGSPVPVVAAAEPGPPAAPKPDPPEEDSVVIGGNATTAGGDVAELDAVGPDLDRLSTVAPQLAIVGASAWVLIRNPKEVEQFLKNVYASGNLPPDEKGSVDVTLWIDRTGAVKWAEISRSSGEPRMDQIALKVFNKVASFFPARDAGRNVPISVMFSLNFPW